MKARNALLTAGVAATLVAMSAGAFAYATADVGSPRFGGKVSLKADEGVPQDMVTAMKADQGVPQNLVTAMKADEGVPQNLVVAMKADQGVPQNLVTA